MVAGAMGAPKCVLNLIDPIIEGVTEHNHINPFRFVILLGKLLNLADKVVNLLLRARQGPVQSEHQRDLKGGHHPFREIGDVVVEQLVVGDAQLLVVDREDGGVH